jgi:hypothetical protein
MKKLTALVLVAFVFASFTACKQHEKCPAYGKANYKSSKKAA